MGSVLHDTSDQGPGLRTVLPRPVNDPGRRPLQILLMGFGHMFLEGGMASPVHTSGMNGNPFVLEQDFNYVLGDPDFHLFFD